MSNPNALTPSDSSTIQRPIWPLAILGGLLLWAYLPMLSVFAEKWIHDPQYSHGLLVPIFSAFLLRRAWKAGPLTMSPMPTLGYGLLILALLMRIAAGSILFHQLDAASLLLVFVGVSLIVGGRPLLHRTGPAIAFLIFMIPLPYELERNVGQPLKVAATASSTYLLQTLGQPAIRDGNLILIDEVRLGVVDACSGLKMLVTFAAFSVGAVLLLDRSRFEKLMVLLGIIPIAIVSNVLRITATGLSYAIFTNKNTVEFLHDLHGWLMMPVGLALLALELWVLKKLVVEPETTSVPVLRLSVPI
ncbi:MAG TPA: exosortase/archaeosortase family protein [Gemmata sp.]|jgi:exosortase|nr:exosortase/archaeosortase family protein [Gemmata sp.]